MGLVNFGIPKDKVEFLRKLMSLNVFVEGGTYKGGTAKLMSRSFSKVYTIEKSSIMYDIAKSDLQGIPNIQMLKGDTRDYLEYILEKNDNILFWLDAHWSGGDTCGRNNECPLIAELKIIFEYSHKNQMILIDDARLFLAPPPKPHKIEHWPSLTEIFKTIPKNWEIIELDDVIYIIPKRYIVNFKNYLQGVITNQLEKNSNRFFYRFKRKIGLCECNF